MWKINVLKQLAKGETNIQYKTKTGSMKAMDVSLEAVEPWGVIPFQSVVTPKGEATVIGVADGHLWFHCRCDGGASYWNSYKTKEDLKQNEVFPQRRNSVESRAKIQRFDGGDYNKPDPDLHSMEIEHSFACLKGSNQAVSCMGFDSDLLYVSFQGDSIITSWDLGSNMMRTIYKHKAIVVSFCIAEFAVYSGSADWKLNVFDKESGTQIQSIIPHNGPIQSLCLGSFKGVEVILTGSRDHTVISLEVPSFEKKARFLGHEAEVTAVLPVHDTFHVMDLDLVYTSTKDGVLRAFDVEDKESVWTNYIANANASINALARFRDRLFSADTDNCIRVYDRLGGKLLDKWEFESSVNAILVSEEDCTVFAGLADGRVIAIDCETSQYKKTFAAHGSPIKALAVNDKTILVGAEDGTIRLFMTKLHSVEEMEEVIDISEPLQTAHSYTRVELVSKIDKLIDLFHRYKKEDA